jgi:hypothetical protein
MELMIWAQEAAKGFAIFGGLYLVWAVLNILLGT